MFATAAFLPHLRRNVERSEVIRGYEHDDSQYVLVEDEEMKKTLPRSGRTMGIAAFVKEAQIDPIYFDSSFCITGKRQRESLRSVIENARVKIASPLLS